MTVAPVSSASAVTWRWRPLNLCRCFSFFKLTTGPSSKLHSTHVEHLDRELNVKILKLACLDTVIRWSSTEFKLFLLRTLALPSPVRWAPPPPLYYFCSYLLYPKRSQAVSLMDGPVRHFKTSVQEASRVFARAVSGPLWVQLRGLVFMPPWCSLVLVLPGARECCRAVSPCPDLGR